MRQPAKPIIASPQPSAANSVSFWLWIIVFLCGIGGVAWLVMVQINQPEPRLLQPTQIRQLQSGNVATMDSAGFTYSPGWHVDKTGADPREPAHPLQEPSGTVTFGYTGSELDLLLAIGDYWGYLYVTIDGQPANLLPVIPGNHDSQGAMAGYRTFYAPEKQGVAGASEQWVRVHRAPGQREAHQVRIEIWRSWGQRPLRAVAIDALPPRPYPRWPGVALLVIAGWGIVLAASRSQFAPWLRANRARRVPIQLTQLLQPVWIKQSAPLLAIGGLLLIVIGVALHQWLITLAGLAWLAWVALQRPVLWLSALLFALPFYYAFPLPILPNRALSLIDVGILGGIFVCSLHWLLASNQDRATDQTTHTTPKTRVVPMPTLLLLAITSWALIVSFNAENFAVAFHEWRTVFLMASLLGLLLIWIYQNSENQQRDQWWLMTGWLAGSVVVALVGLWQYASGAGLITAEGVWRVRAFYGSPNNLALYLERTLAVTLAFALFTPTLRPRLWWSCLTVLQAAALLLTFSKGALLFGLPALLFTLWFGGLVLLAERNQSRRPLWWIAAAGIFAIMALTPFLGAERFQRLLDFRQGTGFVRLQLWQSAWQMALDHRWLGVGPDNFLYTFRSYYILPAAWQEPNLNHPHNWLLDWWTRLGLPGLALAVAFFGITMRQLWVNVRHSAAPILSLGLLAAVVTGLAHGLIDASYALPDLMIVWALLANLDRPGLIEPQKKAEVNVKFS
ncbi:MAG: O-antigen ligase family protein [Chloroflexi bacterium]|nr:O-antigen ligase family protein [Chloroflexota bacterium]